MDKKYIELMQKQNISADVSAQFYEKLEKTHIRRKPIRWKAAIAAACIALLIPLTAFAIENIYRTPKVKVGKLDWHDSPNGFSVHFDNLKDFPLETFPKEMRYITQLKRVPCESWEAAEKTLGIDLVNNIHLGDTNKSLSYYDDLGSVYGYVLYTPHEGQLYYVSACAFYNYRNVQLHLTAEITVEHPDLDAETSRVLHGVEGVIITPDDAKSSYETYTTQAGIPVAILRLDLGSVIHYDAVFAVNDISYELNVFIKPEKEETAKQVLLDVLNGFEIN